MYVCMYAQKVEIVYTCIYTSVYVLLSGKYLSYTDISFKKMFRRQQQHFRPGSRVFIAPGILEVNRTTAVLLFPSTIADTDVAAERFTPIYIMFNCMYVCMYVHGRHTSHSTSTICDVGKIVTISLYILHVYVYMYI